jgi:hypothetical protein
MNQRQLTSRPVSRKAANRVNVVASEGVSSWVYTTNCGPEAESSGKAYLFSVDFEAVARVLDDKAASTNY